MTVYGWDASDYDWMRGAMDYRAARYDGIEFTTHKITEGTGIIHEGAGAALTRMHDADIKVIGTYHVVRSVNVQAQIAHYLRQLDIQAPGWRSHPNWVHQIDLENWEYDRVAASTGIDFANKLMAETDQFITMYASKGQYGDALRGCPVPLWNANYGANPAGWYHSNYPGDNSSRWNAYSGLTPMFLQYGSRNSIGSQPACDANAFRGTIAQLITITTRGGSLMAGAEEIIQKWSQGISYTGDGQLVCPVEWRLRDQEWQKQTDAQLAALNLTLAALHAKVDTLAAGGVSVDAVADAVIARIAQRLGSNG